MDEIITDVDMGISLVEAKTFKWMCGMKTACGVRIKAGWQIDTWLKSFGKDEGPVPDINDPATKGCLLQLVRDISDDKDCYVCAFAEGWAIQEWPEPAKYYYAETEGRALGEYILRHSMY